MNKITPRTAMILHLVLLIAAFPIAMMADSTGSMALYIATFALLGGSLAIRMLLCRCPRCGSLLQSPWQNFCPKCGHNWKE